MKVGDYVRTKKGIERITDIKEWVNFQGYEKIITTDKNQYKTLYERSEIIKSNPNIIDLIEVGDYVNGSRVEEIEEYNGEKYLYLEEMEYSNANQDYINVYCKQEYIKSIVIKEQFESMEYKIGE